MSMPTTSPSAPTRCDSAAVKFPCPHFEIEHRVPALEREALDHLADLVREPRHADPRCGRVADPVVQPGGERRVERALRRGRSEVFAEQVQHARAQRHRAATVGKAQAGKGGVDRGRGIGAGEAQQARRPLEHRQAGIRYVFLLRRHAWRSRRARVRARAAGGCGKGLPPVPRT